MVKIPHILFISVNFMLTRQSLVNLFNADEKMRFKMILLKQQVGLR